MRGSEVFYEQKGGSPKKMRSRGCRPFHHRAKQRKSFFAFFSKKEVLASLPQGVS
jgi:hypothetical protein